MPIILLNWRLWAGLAAALTLATSHWFAFHQGGLASELKLANYQLAEAKVENTALTVAIKRGDTLQDNNTKVQNDYLKLKKTSAIGAASAESERLQLLASLDAARAGTTDSPTSPRVDATPAERILGESLKEYEAVARDADTISDTLTGLQLYVSNVCLAK